MTLRVLRVDATDDRTIGVLLIDHRFQAYSLEDRVLPVGAVKVPGQTAIPGGLYRVAITMSARFKRPLPILVDVPGFSGIRIHAGNTDEDTAGCLLLGLDRDTDTVLESRAAVAAVQPMIQTALDAGEPVWCSVENLF